MRLAVVILVMLGIVAAGAAVLLVQVIQNRDVKEKTVQVVLTQADLPARTRLTKENVKLTTVPVRGLPQGYYVNTAQVIGKVLKVAVTEGQPLTADLLTAKAGVAEMLRDGMLAFSAPVSKRDTAVNLLVPGSVVDVQVTFPLRNSKEGDSLVFTLLQQIRVLGIDDETVASQGLEDKTARRASSSGNVMVTLEVSDRQARALGLALKNGSIALPLRNPTDHTYYPIEVMVLKEGRLTAGSKSLDPQELLLFTQLTQLLAGQTPDTEPNAPTVEVAADPKDPNAAPARITAPVPAPMLRAPLAAELGAAIFQQTNPATQKVTIIRAQEVEEVELEVKEEEKPKEEVGD